MKLTKAQRLFVAIGRVDMRIEQYSAMLKGTPWQKLTVIHMAYYFKNQHLQALKALRKRLIREALEAARSENTEHYMNGINEVLRLITLNTLRHNEKTGLKPYHPEAAGVCSKGFNVGRAGK